MSKPGDHIDPPEAGGDPAGGLGRRFLVGTMQLGAGHVGVSTFNLAAGILLARWLGPNEFGLFAFVFGVSELLSIVGAFSLGAALIQAREESQALYDTAFAISGGLGLIALLLAGVLAPFMAEMRSSEASWFLIALAGSRVLRFLAQVPRAKLERTMRYDRVTLLAVIESSVPNMVALALAFSGVGAWALVIRDVLVSALTLILETAASGYRFRSRVQRAESQQLMRFARPMFVTRSVDILVERIDRVVVGAVLGNAPAGLLDRSRFLADMGLYVIRPIERAGLNLLSRLQDDHQRLSRSFSIINYFVVRLMFLGAVVLIVSPVESLRLILGDEWIAAAPALRFLGIHAAAYSVHSMVKVLAFARHEVGRLARISITQACILVPGSFAAAHYGGLMWVAGVIALTTCVGALLSVLRTRDLATVAYRQLLGGPVLVAAATAGVITLGDAYGALDSLFWAVRPFAVGALFALGIVAIERRQLLAELRYLRTQLRS